jgi:hypothetical protein
MLYPVELRARFYIVKIDMSCFNINKKAALKAAS